MILQAIPVSPVLTYLCDRLLEWNTGLVDLMLGDSSRDVCVVLERAVDLDNQ